VEFQAESLHQQVLQHREELFLRRFGRVFSPRVHIESQIASLNPIRTSAQILHRDAERDADQVTEPRVCDDAAAERRRRLIRTDASRGVDSVTTSSIAVIPGCRELHRSHFEREQCR